MSSGNTIFDVEMLINVLSEGEEQTRQLETSLDASSSSDQHCKMLVQQIHASFQNAITIAKMIESTEYSPQGNNPVYDSPRSKMQTESSTRVVRKTECSEMRNKQPKWSNKVCVAPGESMEEVLNDGYNWRKYGQKDILGAKHPRGYFRCAYRNTVGCVATKQVQRSDENPCIFDIVYRGEHTCIQKTQGVMPPQPEAQHQSLAISSNQPMLQSFEASLKQEFEDMDIQDQALSSSSFSFPSTPLAEFMPDVSTSSPTFASPSTETMYFPVSEWSNTPRTD